jgi:hypothetical protein
MGMGCPIDQIGMFVIRNGGLNQILKRQTY